MIDIQHVSKRYGKFLANDDISFSVAPGKVAVLLGPNGAGKSTLIKSVTGLLRFDGIVTIDGFENHSVEAKRRLAYVPELPSPYPLLTVYEHLEFVARIHRLDESWKARADGLLSRFDLSDKTDKLGKSLSKGMQQKVSICSALLTQPKALIMDEPLVGLDPHAIRALKEIIHELKNNGTALIISTHMIESVERDWDETHIMMHGQIQKTCVRSEANGEDLEELYFAITEGKG